MNDLMKAHILRSWEKYDVVSSEEEMLALLNILQAHGETLDSLHDVVCNGRYVFCDIVFNSYPDTDREVADSLKEHNCFYKTREQMLEAIKDDAECADMSIEEFLKTEDVRETMDGFVRVLYY